VINNNLRTTRSNYQPKVSVDFDFGPMVIDEGDGERRCQTLPDRGGNIDKNSSRCAERVVARRPGDRNVSDHEFGPRYFRELQRLLLAVHTTFMGE
jgi:hypothetical protein